jgi:flagellar protein FlaG
MTLPIGQLTTVQPAAPTPRTAGSHAPETTGTTPVHPAPGPKRVDTLDIIPAKPPAQVLDEVRAAAKRAEELHAQDRELHFSKDAASGRVVIQVRTAAGDVLRTIPPSKALAVMTGEEL